MNIFETREEYEPHSSDCNIVSEFVKWTSSSSLSFSAFFRIFKYSAHAVCRLKQLFKARASEIYIYVFVFNAGSVLS